MVTMYPSAGQNFLQEHSSVYDKKSPTAVKQEIVFDSAMDMSLTSHERPRNVPRLHESIGSDTSKDEFYSPYISPSHPVGDVGVDMPLSSPPEHSASLLYSSAMERQKSQLAFDSRQAVSDNVLGNLDLLPLTAHQRARREFVPENKKDQGYWSKRIKNNDSARRSRVKRKTLEKLMETRLLELQKENIELKHEMEALKRRFGLSDSSLPGVPPEAIPRSFSCASSASSSAGGEKMSREEELEQQSVGSDDSRSHDDSRMYSVGSVGLLNSSLAMGSREQTDSLSSPSSFMGAATSSSLAAMGMSKLPAGGSKFCSLRIDKTGALDLTSEHSSNRSSSPESCASVSGLAGMRRFSCVSSDGSVSDNVTYSYDDGTKTKEMKAFPLKCRWKKEMQSAHIADLYRSKRSPYSKGVKSET